MKQEIEVINDLCFHCKWNIVSSVICHAVAVENLIVLSRIVLASCTDVSGLSRIPPPTNVICGEATLDEHKDVCTGGLHRTNAQ